MLRLTELLEQPARICARPQTLPVWHCSIHNHPDDPILTDQQWEHVATEITAAVGLAPHGDLDAIRWILPKPNQEPKSPFRSEEYLDGLGSRVDCEVWRRRLGRRPVGGDQHVGVADFRGDTVGVMAS